MDNCDRGRNNLTADIFMDGLVRFGLLAILVFLCFRVFSPFWKLTVLALVLAVTLYPLHQYLAGKLKNRQGRVSILLVLSGLLLVGVPGTLLTSSLTSQIVDLHAAYKAGSFSLEPAESIASWPVIGGRVYTSWKAAAENLPNFIKTHKAVFESTVSWLLKTVRGTASSLFLFLGALIVSGIMMAYGRGGAKAGYAIIVRMAGPAQGGALFDLATKTTRSVALGVIGVACIQALLLGIGFVFAGVPGAGVLAVVVMLLGIMQLPALLVCLPVIIWIWMGGDGGTPMNIVWSVYLILAGAVDNILKPMLLGRGVEAPMPVILLGALGGMASAGFIGLFTGSIILAVGYQVFMQWVNSSNNANSITEDGKDNGSNMNGS